MPASVIAVDTTDAATSHSNLSNGSAGSPRSEDGPTPTPTPVDPGIFPLLRHNNDSDDSLPLPSAGAASTARVGGGDGMDDDEPAVAKPFPRTSSPVPNSGAPFGDDDEDTPPPDGQSARRHRPAHKMHKFSLYETASRYYIVGGDIEEKRFRILKIDRNEDSELSINDDKTVYSRKEMSQLLDTIDDGNKGTGGIRLRCTAWGLLGFIRFTGPYYMLLITKKSTAAMIGGHFVYQIDDTEMVPLTPAARFKTDHKSVEARYLNGLHGLDINHHFYYSNSYDITHTLQYNITRERTAVEKGESCDHEYNSMFVWNTYLMKPALKDLSSPFDWCRAVIHGCINQAAIDVYGRRAHVAVVARRSRFFAGARFLKRGVNDLGYVANDVETEQIVSEVNTTSFHAPGPQLFASPSYTSHVQHRGSIPLFWTQENTGVTPAPKPPIEMGMVDPFYRAAARHFDNLFERYGAPIYVLNLVKVKERLPRESKLLDAFTICLEYLNQFLPEGKKLIHHPWDMSNASKAKVDVIGVLEGVAEEMIATTGFFHNGDGVINPIRLQNGVARTNCIDCLDRTNAAQFVIGKSALGHQLHALGILEDSSIRLETDVMDLLTNMYHDLGDTIALQYGGSQLVNTMETYRKINQWSSHSRDMLESFKRYYNNSFIDKQRQEAYNLFLGYFVHAPGQPLLWELQTDYYLHHSDPREWLALTQMDFTHWYTDNNLKTRTLPPYAQPKRQKALTGPSVAYYNDYWLEYYRPFSMSSFLNMFPFRMNSTIKSIPFKFSQDGHYDLSPFRVRNEGDQAAQDKKKAKKKDVVVALPPRDLARLASPNVDDAASILSETSSSGRGIRGWLQPGSSGSLSMTASSMQSILNEGGGASDEQLLGQPPRVKPSRLEKTRVAQWNFTKMVQKSLSPSVNVDETDDYDRYVRHPQNLPLVVSAEMLPDDERDNEYQEYINGGWQFEGLVPASAEDDVALYSDLLKVGENPLAVTEEDAVKKRYKVYGKWLRGKSLFKQQAVE